MNKTVVFILSTNFAGSHFASLLIGGHSRVLHVGELRHYRKRRSKTQRVACRVCDGGCALLEGVSPGSIGRVHETIFQNAGAGIDALVDTSKKTRWAARFLDRRGYQKKFLHLIRDPRALAWRWDSYYVEPREVRAQRLKWARRNAAALPRLLFAPPRELYLYKWLRQNRDISRFIRRHGLDHRVVSYRDLARDTGAQMQRIMAWIGLDFEPGQLDYWNFDHHGTQKAEYEWVKREQVRLFDTRWKEALSEEESRRIASHRAVERYLTSLRLRAVDDGITATFANSEREGRGASEQSELSGREGDEADADPQGQDQPAGDAEAAAPAVGVDAVGAGPGQDCQRSHGEGAPRAKRMQNERRAQDDQRHDHDE